MAIKDVKIMCLYDALIDPIELKDNPKNRNKHGQDQIERLAEIYKYQGIRHPIIVSKLTGFIVAGHGRKLAAIRAGVDQMPVVYQDFENFDQEYAFVQSDNAVALWADLDIDSIKKDLEFLNDSFNIDMLGIHNFTLDMSDKEFLTDENEVPEHVETKSKLGDIYQLGNHRLMCGDSTSLSDVEKLMNGKKADMVFTDPPYGINYSAENMGLKNKATTKKFDVLKNDESDATDLVSCCFTFECKKIIFGANNFLKALPHSGVWHCWDKRSNNVNDTALADGLIGSMFELAWVDKTSGYQAIFRIKHGGILNADGGKRKHPTQKPIRLFEEMMEHEKAGKNIVDLFGGSGSTLIACEKTNRKCFMMELDPHYVDVIVARWENFTGKKAELLNVYTKEKHRS